MRARERDAAAVVLFIGIPGIGKGTLCAALADALPQEHYHLQHLESDALKAAGGRGRGPSFWPAVAQAAVTHRGDGRATVVLADKNAIDSPAGAVPFPSSHWPVGSLIPSPAHIQQGC